MVEQYIELSDPTSPHQLKNHYDESNDQKNMDEVADSRSSKAES